MPDPPRRRRFRRALALVLLLAAAATAVVATRRGGDDGEPRRSRRPSPAAIAQARTAALPPPAGAPRAAGRGYLTTFEELRTVGAAARRGEQPAASAVAGLLVEADELLVRRPSPQADIDIHDDRGPFVDDTSAAYTLAVAWAVTEDRHYAVRAADFIDAWVRTAAETTDACPDSGRCQTSLVISRTAPGFVLAADLLGPSGDWTDDADRRFRTWLRDLILPAASVRTNNWGDAGTWLRVVATDYLGDAAGYDAALAKWRAQTDLIAADGHIPEETRRGRQGMNYTEGAITWRTATAVVAQRRGVDLWGYEGAQGATLKDAVDFLASYWQRPDEWPFAKLRRAPKAGVVWELAYQRWCEPSYLPMVREARPASGTTSSASLRWTTVTNGAPLGDACAPTTSG